MNLKRYRDYKAELNALIGSVNEHDLFHTVDAKLVDWMAKHPDVSTAEIRLFVERMYKPLFAEYSTNIFDSFDTTVKMVNSLYSDLGNDISREVSSVRAIESVNKSYLGRFSTKELEWITSKVEKGISKGFTKAELSEYIKGSSDTVSFYADTIAKTQIKSYGQILKNEKALIGEVDFFRYVDQVLRDNSHEFCIREVGIAGQGISKSRTEISTMNNGTDLPVMEYRGGWNCNHDWEPDPFYKK